MRGVVRKLKSRSGASIIIALLVLLICITAGAAALTAAGANAGRYTHMARDQQRYLAVSSAAKLVRSELGGQSFTAQVVMEENQGAALDDDPNTQPFALSGLTGSYTGVFEDWLGEDLNALLQATAIPQEWLDQAGLAPGAGAGGVKYTGLGFDVDAEAPLLSQVEWELELEEDYTLKARFWLADEGTRYYPTTLTLPAQVQETTSEPEPVGAGMGRWRTTKTVSVSWDEAEAAITQG